MADPPLIAIETSGRKGSVAVARGPELLAERGFAADSEHARDLVPEAEAAVRQCALRTQDIEQCYVSIGPGSFTGLRVAVTFARHLALAVGVRVVAVPTLNVIAANALAVSPPPRTLAVVLDAKRGQVYGATFQLRAGAYERVLGPDLFQPEALLRARPAPVAVVGEGIAYHRSALEGPGVELLDSSLAWPRAAAVHALGWQMACRGSFTPARELGPLYVRRPEAEEIWEKKSAGGRPGPR